MQLKLYRRGVKIANTYSLIDIIDSFISIRWIRSYYEPGSCELKLNYSPKILSKFQKDDIIVLRENEACYIETIQKNKDDDKCTVTIKGRKLSNMIGRRVNKGTIDIKSTTADIIMLMMFSNNVSYVSAGTRGLANFLSSGTTATGLKKIDYQNTFGNLIKEFTKLSKENEIGYKIVPEINKVTCNFYFWVYQGRDLTRSQSVNQRVVFSDEEVDSVDYTTTTKDSATMVYVGGEGEGADRKVIVLNDEATGFDRYEMFVDARDLQSEYYEDDNKVILTEEEYIAKLEQRGKEKLEEKKIKDVYKVKLRTVGKNQYKYLEDYDLGDLVTFRDRDLEEFVNLRITKIVEFYEGQNVKTDITLGDDVLTGSIF